MIDYNEIYSLNSDYVLKHDKNRSLIISKEILSNNGTSDWTSMIHPEQAIILSFFTHKYKLKDALNRLSEYLKLPLDKTKSIVLPFINNKKEIYTLFDGRKMTFPKNLIIQGSMCHKEYFPKDFVYSGNALDFDSERLYVAPNSITLMLTNKCATSCIYCYADTNYCVKNKLDISLIKKIISQADKLNIVDIGVIGGEFFLYKRWRDVLIELKKYNYQPDIISTKIPINENDILFLKSIGISKIQLSLDSSDRNLLKELLNVSENYLNELENTLGLLSLHDFSVQIATTLTKKTANIKNILSLFNFLGRYTCVTNVDIGAAFYSLYPKVDFFEWAIDKSQFIHVVKFIKSSCYDYKFKINIDTSLIEKKIHYCKTGSQDFLGASCSANRDHMFILPDGKVTICEQLYWNEKFIVGDINNNSIEEVWNSSSSMKFAKLCRSDFSDASTCKKCQIFDKCHSNINKCWADIIKAYGDNNWDFPDPRCFFSPPPINKISIS